MESPAPESPDPPRKDLGTFAEVFGPSRANIVAGYILAGGAVLAGLALIVWGIVGISPAKGRPRELWEDIAIRAMLGVFGVAVGSLAFVFGELTRSIREVRIYWHGRGFRYVDQDRDRVVLWSDISSVTERIDHERLPIFQGAAGALLPRVAARSLMVTTRDGEKFGFDANRVKKLAKLAKYLRHVADKYSIPWTIDENYE